MMTHCSPFSLYFNNMGIGAILRCNTYKVKAIRQDDLIIHIEMLLVLNTVYDNIDLGIKSGNHVCSDDNTL